MGGVYDGLSTRIAHRAGFEVLFMGGFSVAATLLGEPDFGYLTQTEMADTARRVCRLTDRPLLVDADTGYGNPLNVMRTVELYHAAGAAGLFLEDQVWPKRCGHMQRQARRRARRVAAKLRAVLETRGERDLFLVARTDARAAVGLDEAIARGQAARDLGADAVFIEAPGIGRRARADRARHPRTEGRQHGRARQDAAAVTRRAARARLRSHRHAARRPARQRHARAAKPTPCCAATAPCAASSSGC